MISQLAFICFGLAGLAGTIRLLIGPGLAERVMALDVTLISLMGALTVVAARTDDTTYLIALIVIAIIGFTATVAASRFLEHDENIPEGRDA